MFSLNEFVSSYKIYSRCSFTFKTTPTTILHYPHNYIAYNTTLQEILEHLIQFQKKEAVV